MKAVIKVKTRGAHCCPHIIDNGDWIDLCARDSMNLAKGHYTKIPLGVSIELPPGYEAILASRSSLYGKTGLYNPGGIGVIDNSFKGDNDEWQLPVWTCRNYNLQKGERVAQFRLQLSQKATLWQRIKWLFTSGVRIKCVSTLGNKNRGSFGSTGK